MKMHHTGIAVKDIPKEVEKIKKMHKIRSISDIIYDPLQDAELCFVEIEDDVNIEFISGKQVEKVIAKGMSYYHICYESDDFETDIANLKKNGALPVSAPKPAVLFGGRKVAFFYVSYGLIEIVEGEIK